MRADVSFSAYEWVSSQADVGYCVLSLIVVEVEIKNFVSRTKMFVFAIYQCE